MSEPIVTVEQGKLRGKVSEDYTGGKFYSFQGVPYGKAPVGDLRFKAPLPAEPWAGIRDATAEGNESVSKHMLFDYDVGDEDCLNLCVYTSQLPENRDCQLKPVMLWIHGGGFVSGSNKVEVYGPEFLVTEDIVLVVINYRLGILGFLSVEDPEYGVPGNAGLKDMVLALKWVQKNISQFCGDPNNVTIFGESAGSVAVHYLLLSPLAKGLFHRAILQSGCTLNPFSYGSRNAPEVAKVLGYTGKNDYEDILNFLRSVPAKNFLKAQIDIKDALSIDEVRPFSPVVEKPHEGAFISQHPLDIMLSGNYNQVPVLIGYTTHEGMLFEIIQKKNGGPVTHRMKNFEHAVPAYYNIPKGSELSKSIAKKIEDFYFGSSKSPEDDAKGYYNFCTDGYFLRGIYVTVKAHMKTLNQPLYFYRFSAESGLNMYKKVGNISAPGVCHADDLGYLFKTAMTELVPSSLEEKLMKRMIRLWANFARTGNPNPKEVDALIDVVWPKATSEKLCCMDISEKLNVVVIPEEERMKFWDSVSSTNGINSKL